MGETEPDAILTVREACAYLKLSESTVYRLAQEGSLPGRKLGGAWRFSRKRLDEYIAAAPDHAPRLKESEES